MNADQICSLVCGAKAKKESREEYLERTLLHVWWERCRLAKLRGLTFDFEKKSEFALRIDRAVRHLRLLLRDAKSIQQEIEHPPFSLDPDPIRELVPESRRLMVNARRTMSVTIESAAGATKYLEIISYDRRRADEELNRFLRWRR